jgi:hypothetical protein
MRKRKAQEEEDEKQTNTPPLTDKNQRGLQVDLFEERACVGEWVDSKREREERRESSPCFFSQQKKVRFFETGKKNSLSPFSLSHPLRPRHRPRRHHPDRGRSHVDPGPVKHQRRRVHRDQAGSERERAVHQVQARQIFRNHRGGVVEPRRLHDVLGRDLDVVLRQLGVEVGDERVVVGRVRDGLRDGVLELLPPPAALPAERRLGAPLVVERGLQLLPRGGQRVGVVGVLGGVGDLVGEVADGGVGEAAPGRGRAEHSSAGAASGRRFRLLRPDDRERAHVGVRGVVEHRERVQSLGHAALAEDEHRGEQVGEVAVGGLVVAAGGGFFSFVGFFGGGGGAALLLLLLLLLSLRELLRRRAVARREQGGQPRHRREQQGPGGGDGRGQQHKQRQ